MEDIDNIWLRHRAEFWPQYYNFSTILNIKFRSETGMKMILRLLLSSSGYVAVV